MLSEGLYTLYHYPLCALSRKIRILLKEKGVNFVLIQENYWQRNNEMLIMNPSGDMPVLITPDSKIINEHYAISEYIEELSSNYPLMGYNIEEKAEVRRLCSWFDDKFYHEVTKYLVNEKVIKTLTNSGYPNSDVMRSAKQIMAYHLEYISYVTERHKWLAGDFFSLADIAAAAQISTIDYLNDINWEKYPAAKIWYSVMKSRPSMRQILADSIPSFPPPDHYCNPDF